MLAKDWGRRRGWIRGWVFFVAAVLVAELLVAQAPVAADEQGADRSAVELPGLASSPAPEREVRKPQGDFSRIPSLPADGTPPSSSYDPARSVELPAETSPTRKVFANPDGTVTEFVATGPVRFVDATGAWRDIDLTAVPSPDGLLRARSAAWSAALPAAVTPGGPTITIETAAGPIVSSVEGLVGASGVVEGQSVLYSDALSDGRDLRLTLIASGAKTSVVVPNRAGTGRYLETYLLPPGVVARQTEGGVDFVGETDVVARVSDGFASDATNDEAPVDVALVEQSGRVATLAVAVPDAWFDSVDRVFPVTIDPAFSRTTSDSGALDTYVDSSQSGSSFAGSTELRLGKSDALNAVYRTLLRFELGGTAAANRWVKEAHVRLENFFTYNCFEPRTTVTGGLAAGFSAGTTWSTQPAMDSNAPVSFTDYSLGQSCTGPDTVDLDATGVVDRWLNGTQTPHGFLLFAEDETSVMGLRKFRSAEYGSGVPTLSVTYEHRPDPAQALAPADNAVVPTQVPTLSVAPASDPDVGQSVRYLFQIASGADAASGSVANSGWVSSTSWTPPAGALADGGIYYWKVWTDDGLVSREPGWVRKFSVNLRLGVTTASPMDSAGPVSVNLATGNVALSTSSPAFSAVGGSMGLTFAYNSQAPTNAGLVGRYYNDWDGSRTFSAADGPPAMTRQDPWLYFLWGPGSPDPVIRPDDFLVEWTGYVSVPNGMSGTWYFGGQSDDGLRVWIDDVNVLDSWQVQSGCCPQFGAPVSMTEGQPKRIRVQMFEAQGNAMTVLLAKRDDGDATTTDYPMVVDSSWLTTDNPALPNGWTVSADLDGAPAYSKLSLTGNSAVVSAVDGSTSTFARSGDVFVSPSDERGAVLARDADGRFSLHAEDGQTYVFDASGLLNSATSPLDTANGRAAPQLTVTVPRAGGPTRLTKIADPLSGRETTLAYGGGGASCPTSPAGFDSAPPLDMLCRVTWPDRTASSYFYKAQQLARIVDPGGEVTDFGYEGGLLTQLRDPLTADVVASGARADNETTRWVVTYDWSRRATSVTGPEPRAGDARPSRTYTYSTSATEVTVAGLRSSGFSRRVTFDAALRVTSDTDAAGVTATTEWATDDRVLSTTSFTQQPDTSKQRKATTIYDAGGRVTDVFGPAPASSFAADRRPTVAASVAASSTVYDQDATGQPLRGLAARYWKNMNQKGAPDLHDLGSGESSGALFRDWGLGGPDGLGQTDGWSARWTGEVQLDAVGAYEFRAFSDDGVRVVVDDQVLIDSWVDGAASWRPVIRKFTNSVAGSWHRIRVDYYENQQGARFELHWTRPDGVGTAVPGSVLRPDYRLASTTTQTGGTVASEVTRTEYAAPHLGLATATVVDPAGLNLRSTTTFDDPFRRRTARTLPAGASSALSYTYWDGQATGTSGCAGTAVSQGGFLRFAQSADPDGAGPLVGLRYESEYDAAGRPRATRVRGTDQTLSAWRCTAYDARGRVVSATDRDGRTSTFDYSVPGRVVSQFVDSANVSRTTRVDVDLLGRTVAYLDEQGTETTHLFDQAGRITSTSRKLAGASAPTVLVTYDFDDQGRVSKIHDFGSGADRVSTVTYDPITGAQTSTALPNGVTSSTTYDPVSGLPASVAYSRGGSSVASSSVTRTKNGRVSAEAFSDATGRSLQRSYVYDAADRLTQAADAGTVSGATRNYEYDANTNRGPLVSSCASTGYRYDLADRLLCSPQWSGVTYDRWGNMTEATFRNASAAVERFPAGTSFTYGNSEPVREFPVTVSSSGTFSASVQTAPSARFTTTRTDAVAAGSTVEVNRGTVGLADLAASLQWPEADGTVSPAAGGTLQAAEGWKGVMDVAPNRTGLFSAQLDWSNSTITSGGTGNIAALNGSRDHDVEVSGNGTLRARVWWESSLTPRNYDIQLLLNGTVVASAASPTGSEEVVELVIGDLPATGASRTYQLRVTAVGIGSNYNFEVVRPQTAATDFRLVRRSTGATVASSTATAGRRERKISVSGLTAGEYRLEARSLNHPAPFSVSSTYLTRQRALLQARWVRDGVVVSSSAVSQSGSLGVRAESSGGGWKLAVANLSPGIPAVVSSSLDTTSVAADPTMTYLIGVQGVSSFPAEIGIDGSVRGRLVWDPTGLSYPTMTLSVVSPSGQTLASASSSSGSLDVSAYGAVPGRYHVMLERHQPGAGSFSLTISKPAAPAAAAVGSLELVSSSGVAVAGQVVSGSNPKTVTAAVSPGGYRLRVVPSGQGVASVSGSWPGETPTLKVAYDAHDHAVRVEDGRTVTAETLAPSGRVLRRTVTVKATGAVEEDTRFGYADGGDSPAYAIAASGALATFGPLGAVHEADLSSSWPVVTVHGDVVGRVDGDGGFSSAPLTDEFGLTYGPDARDGTRPQHRLGWLGAHQRYATSASTGIIRMGVRLYHPSVGRFLQVDPVEGGVENDYVYPADPINEFDLDGMKKCKTWDVKCKLGKTRDFVKRNAGTIATVGACLSTTAVCVAATVGSVAWGAYQRRKNGAGWTEVGAAVAIDIVAYRLGGRAVRGAIKGKGPVSRLARRDGLRGELGTLAIRSFRTGRQVSAGGGSMAFSEWRTSRHWAW